MNLLANLTSDPTVSLFGRTYDISLNWIGEIIRWLIEGIGIIGVGIVVFSLILKTIVLPFDIFQRISMRKQNLKMRDQKEKLEKLQKQYANDKTMYNQKMMEMYKENGISMFSSCLPMILSLVVFFVAIGAFNDFSQYANLQNYNLMVNAYNDALVPYTATVDDILPEYVSVDYVSQSVDGQETQSVRVIVVRQPESEKYIYYTVLYNETLGAENPDYYKADDYAVIKNATKIYRLDTEKLYENDAEAKAAIDAALAEAAGQEESDLDKNDAALRYVLSKAQSAVKVCYDTTVSDRMQFFWVKNIWASDSALTHPVLSYDNFNSTMSRGKMETENGKKVKFSNIAEYTNAYTSESYNVVTGNLSAEKSSANGYFVMIALSIGTMLLQQFITMRSQKEQQQFSSVDGQGGKNNKMMMIVMTVMFGIFAFMYSTAFTIYMVTSNVVSMITTVVINKCVDISFRKKEEKALQEQYSQRFPGRVYVPENKRDKAAADKAERAEKKAAQPKIRKSAREFSRYDADKDEKNGENKNKKDGKK